jgi:2-keto-3-deoxy-L-rhamnonate aldolase RhmA
MALTLMYLTNRPQVAQIAEKAGVDRIWVDLETLGKEDRQRGMDTVKSSHTIEDIKRIREVLKTSKLLVRINPIHDAADSMPGTEEEIDASLAAGAEILMLPMYRTKQEVERFVRAVNKRAKTMLLLETAEAADLLEEQLSVPGVDEVHIGLNDLHLAYHRRFLFELLSDQTVEQLCRRIKRIGIPYGFGGIARIGYGMLPSEYILAEHYRLGSSAAILSRSFCDANRVEDVKSIELLFVDGVRGIRQKEQEVALYTQKQYEENRIRLQAIVQEILNTQYQGKGEA